MTDLIGQSIGRYHVLEQLGEGGMATVYKAYDTRLEREVAVKVIRTDQFAPAVLQRVLKRFEREAKALAKLSHPNIVKVYDFGEYKGSPYLVLEYLPSGTLKQRMGKPIPWQEAVRLLAPIASALEYAHKHDIIHRDIKPSNILITENGQPMLSDFGVAKLLDSEETMELTGTGVGVGTPEYMAPEQVTSKSVDVRADIYALGVVFYEMVTGRKPFTADTPMAVLFKHASEPLPRPKQFVPNLPDSVEKILLKTLAKNPADRYQSMEDFGRALELLLKGQGTKEERVKQPAPTAPKVQSTSGKGILPLWAFGIMGALMLAILMLSIALKQNGLSSVPSPVANQTATLIPTLAPLATSTETFLLTPIPLTLEVTLDVTDTPTANMTFETPQVYGRVHSSNGVVLRATPAGKALTTLDDYSIVQVLPDTQDADNYIWAHVIATQNGVRLTGWIVQLYLDIAVPAPLSSVGDRITFVSNRDGNDEIYVMNDDGSGQTNLTNNSSDDVNPSWSPDGQKIAFESNRDGNDEIYVMNANGSGVTKLTNGVGPAWSPDGNQIAFVSYRAGNHEICVMNANGSGVTRLTNSPTIYEEPIWSPDGKKIAFESNRDGNNEIYVMNANGSGQTNLTKYQANYLDVVWSPDGKKIAFESNRDGNNEIYVMNADGSGQTNLTDNPANDLYPVWSPDGKKIAFESNRDLNWEIYVMNADGSAQTNLINNPAYDGVPSWSPDGIKIAFESNRDGNWQIYVMNDDGSGQTNLTNNPADDSEPAWSP